jgi:para-aminobenzoate synthetase
MTALLSNESDHLARLLIIDHHDSYTLNLLISLIQATECTSSQLLSRLVVLPHNHRLLADIDTFRQQLLPHLDGIILGPGPGQPSNEKDFGPAHNILSSILKKEISIPLLGICLGHQGIATACGGTVVQAESLRHGLASRIIVSGQQAGTLALPSVFEGLQGSGPMEMIRYNSLTVDEPSESIR